MGPQDEISALIGKDTRDFAVSLWHVKTQQRVPHQNPTMEVSSLQDREKRNFLLFKLILLVFCYGNPSRLTHMHKQLQLSRHCPRCTQR